MDGKYDSWDVGTVGRPLTSWTFLRAFLFTANNNQVAIWRNVFANLPRVPTADAVNDGK